MTGLIITLSILLFFTVLLTSPLVMTAEYGEDWKIKLRYLFLVFQLYPEKENTHNKPVKKEKAAKSQKKEEKEDKKPNFKEILKQKGLSGILELLKQTAVLVTGRLQKLFSHVIIRELSLDVLICGDDAADTAVTYGKACAVIYPAVSILAGNTRCKRYGVSVAPDFDGSGTKIKANLKAAVRPVFLIASALSLLVKGIPILKEVKELFGSPNEQKETVK